MKKRSSLFLLLAFVLTTALSAWFALLWMEVVDNPLPLETSQMAFLAMNFPMVPFFFLQLFFLRAPKKRWPRFVPITMVLLSLTVCGCGYLASSGWDSLGWAIFMLLSLLPVPGIFLALLANFLYNRVSKYI